MLCQVLSRRVSHVKFLRRGFFIWNMNVNAHPILQMSFAAQKNTAKQNVSFVRQRTTLSSTWYFYYAPQCFHSPILWAVSQSQQIWQRTAASDKPGCSSVSEVCDGVDERDPVIVTAKVRGKDSSSPAPASASPTGLSLVLSPPQRPELE